MAIGVKAGRMMFQRGTKAQWEASNLVLLDGELAIEADTTKIKIGDGKHKYIDLPYIEIGEIRVADLSEEDIKKITGRKGEKGDPLRFEDLNPEQKKELKGEPFRYEDFTPDQLAKLKGEPGKFDINSLSEEEKKIFKTELVNDLTTGGVDKALSAEQGKVLFQSVDKGKELIAKALVDKNVQASKDESFGDLANKIKEIKSNAPGGGYGVGDIIEAQKIEPITKDNYKYKLALKNKCLKCFLDGQGNYYVINVTEISKNPHILTKYALIKYDKDGCMVWDNKDVTYYFLDGEDNIYIGNTSHLIKYDKNNNEVWKVDLFGTKLQRISSDNEGNFYEHEDNKLIKYNKEKVGLWEIKSVDKYVHDDKGNVYTANDTSIIKYNKDGVKVWTKEFHCDSGLSVDKNGYLYFIVKDGKEYQLMSLDENGETRLTSEKSNKKISFDFNGTDMVIAKISSNVIVYSSHPASERWKVEGTGFKCNNQGNIYVKNRRDKLIKYAENGEILHDYSNDKLIDYGLDEKGNLYLTMKNSLIKYDTNNTKQWEISGARYYCLDKEGDVYFIRKKESVVYKYSKGEEESLYDLKKMNYDTNNDALLTLDNFGNLYVSQLFYSYKLARVNDKIVTGYKIIS